MYNKAHVKINLIVTPVIKPCNMVKLFKRVDPSLQCFVSFSVTRSETPISINMPDITNGAEVTPDSSDNNSTQQSPQPEPSEPQQQQQQQSQTPQSVPVVTISRPVIADDDEYYLDKMAAILDAFPTSGPPQHPCKVSGHVYLGNQKNADDVDLLSALGITHVLNMAGTRNFDVTRYRSF